MLIGAVVALIDLVGFIIGGPQLVLGEKLLDIAIQIAVLGVLFGLLNCYIDGQHEPP